MRTPRVVAALLIAIAASGEDAALAAARAALAADQPVEALTLLAGAPASSASRLLGATARLALGQRERALELLGAADAAGIAAAVERWDVASRGPAAQLGAELALALGDPRAAGPLLERALALGGDGVEPDRCLALDVAALLALDDRAGALRAADRLWRGWPRSPYRARGGLLLARERAEADPTAAREILSAIRADAASAPADRLAAAELLCRILLQEHPGQCLVVAEQDIPRLGAARCGQLPLYRALALARLDPPAGAAALRALPAELAADPLVAEALARAEADARVSVAMRCERAQSLAELGRADQALALLEPIAREEPEALVELCAIDGAHPERWLDAPAARDPRAAVALARAFALAGAGERAWPLLEPLLPVAQREGAAAAGVLYWASQCAPDPAQRERLRRALLDSGAHGLEVGLAWCAEAEARSAAGADAAEAWAHAAAELPAEHPWQPETAWRAARSRAAAGDDAGARGLLDGPASWGADGEANCRCRFLLAQVLARLGDRDGALRAARSLRGHGDENQQRQLEILIADIDQRR